MDIDELRAFVKKDCKSSYYFLSYSNLVLSLRWLPNAVPARGKQIMEVSVRSSLTFLSSLFVTFSFDHVSFPFFLLFFVAQPSFVAMLGPAVEGSSCCSGGSSIVLPSRSSPFLFLSSPSCTAFQFKKGESLQLDY